MSIARLRGEACIGGRAVANKLRVAGHGALRSSTHVWQIMTDVHRRGAVAA
ncbi:hypothetical protein [Streptomyces sp. NPDC090798]|uniref:hypothetical protein n=1 Tax=Streptomyces sp. NPDC090798 TaxID=3365968 RepID=UPI00381BC9C9